MTSTTPHYFEGPEKTLEIDWVPSVGHSTSGLRAITREQWEHLLTLAQCCILSTISNEHLDSYVLSESSLFVYTHKMVIKTCGTTTLLRLLPSLLELTVSLGMKLEWLGYMRKNFSFPRNQLYPHSGFAEELQYLETQCHLVGEAYALGPLNADHWNAFVYDDCDRPMSESTDRTLNIMMYDIDPVVAQHFWKKKGSSSTEATVTGDNTKDPEAAEAAAAAAASTEMSEAALKMAADAVTVNSGIHDLLPSTTIQAHVFDPCGYSMNGLLDSAYYTIHVTPETSSSYVSFETTVKMNDYNALVKNVLSKYWWC